MIKWSSLFGDQRTCPRCGSHDVRRSPHHSLWDDFIGRLSLSAFRCRNCRHRFYLKGQKRGAHEHEGESDFDPSIERNS
jgi:DNA-directed RNA polymerase subunit RPC12/RpoP